MMKVKIYDCQHVDVESLEKELLFNEVMRLRNQLVTCESILEDLSEVSEILGGDSKNRINDYFKSIE